MSELHLSSSLSQLKIDQTNEGSSICCFTSPEDLFLRVESSSSGMKSVGGGRSVIAKKEIPLGQTILSNLPSTHLLLTSLWGSRCIYCFHSKESSGRAFFHVSRCAKCQKASYCSRHCQSKDWKQHKLECSQIKSLWDQYPSQILDEIFILLRQISSEKSTTSATSSSSNKEEDDQTQCHLASYTFHENQQAITQPQATKCSVLHVHNLFSSSAAMVSYEKDYYYQQIITVVQKITKTPKPVILQLLNQFHCNNFGIVDELMNCIGMGVYPNIALLNHSCVPSTILRYLFTKDGPVTEVVAIRKIFVGEEITHSYTDCTNPKHLRQESLRTIYHFQCNCLLCNPGNQKNATDCIDYLSTLSDYLKQDPSTIHPLQLCSLLKTIRTSQQPTSSFTTPVFHVDSFLTQTLTSKMPFKEKEINQKITSYYEKVYYGNVKNEEEEKALIDELIGIDGQLFSLYYGPFHFELYRLRCKLLTLLVLAGDHRNAYRVCCQVVSYLALALINMPFHPLLGIQLFTLGDLAESAEPALAREYYRWTNEILTTCYDMNSNSLLLKLQPFLTSEEINSESK